MLKAIADEIWVAEHSFKMGFIDFGGRMTVIRLADGSLVLYSAIAINDALAAELKALGEVAHIVAPNGFHYLFLEAARQRYPKATVYGTAALAKKQPQLQLDVQLTNQAPPAWGNAIELIVMEGVPSVDEVIFFHRASRTVVVCDLVFNIHEAQGWFSPLFFRMLGVWKQVKQSPLWRWSITKNRAAAEASLERMWSWDFDRVILAHGRIVEGTDAKSQLARGLTWMCPNHEPRLLTA
jgi:hypothetical protein